MGNVEIKLNQLRSSYIPVYVDSITLSISGLFLSSPITVSIPIPTGTATIKLPGGMKKFIAEARGLGENLLLWRGEAEHEILPIHSQSVSIYMNPIPVTGFIHDPIGDIPSPGFTGFDINGVYIKDITSPTPSLLFRIWTTDFEPQVYYVLWFDLDQNMSTSFQFSDTITAYVPQNFGPDMGAIIKECRVKLFYDWSGQIPIIYPYPVSYPAFCDEERKMLEFTVPVTAMFNDDLNLNFIVATVLGDISTGGYEFVDFAPNSGYGTYGFGSTTPFNPFINGLIRIVAGSTYGNGGHAIGLPLGDFASSIYYDGESVYASLAIYGESGYSGVVRRLDLSTGRIYNMVGSLTLDSVRFKEAEFPIPISIGDAGGIWVNSAGVIYLTDPAGCVIRKIDPIDKTSSIVAGVPENCGYNGDGGEAMLNSPSSLFVDERTGEVYFSDTYNHIIRKIQPNRSVITIAGDYSKGGNCLPTDEATYSGPATGACLSLPYTIYPEQSTVGIVGFYVADSGNHIVRYVDLTVQPPYIYTVAGTGNVGTPLLPADPNLVELTQPYYLFYNQDYLFIIDMDYPKILAIDMVDGILYDTGLNLIGNAGGISGDSLSLFYIDFPFLFRADLKSGFPLSNTQVIAGSEVPHGGDGGNAIYAHLDYPTGLTVIGRNLYFGEKYLGTLYRINLDTGIMERVAGNSSLNFECVSVPISSAPDVPVFNIIMDVAIDDVGNIYVAEDGTCAVKKVDFSSGFINVVAGNCSCGSTKYGVNALDTSLFTPTAIAMANDGTLYLAQYDSNAYYAFIDEIRPDNTIHRFAGGITEDFTSPSPVTSGEISLGYVSALSISPDGNTLYIVDSDRGNVYAVDRNLLSVRKVYSYSPSTVSKGIREELYVKKSNLYIGSFLYDVASYKDGYLFLSSPSENKIYEFLEEANIQFRIAGNPYSSAGFLGMGGRARDALIYYPSDIAISKEGELYITLVGMQGIGGRVVRITPR